MATKSPAVRELEQVYTRAQELCQQVGDTQQLLPVLHGLYEFHLVRGAFRTAYELAEQFLRLTQRAEALWFLGYPDQARQRNQEALTLARELAHPMSLVFALLMAARLHIHHREAQTAYEQAATLIQLCTDKGIPNFLAHGAIEQGWALTAQGEGEKGIAQIRQSLAALQALRVEIARPTYLAWLAEAYQRIGRLEEGLSTLHEALEVVRQNEERWYEAELYRLRGELTLQSQASQNKSENTSSQPLTPSTQAEQEVEACFLKAIEIAQKQQAKSLELR